MNSIGNSTVEKKEPFFFESRSSRKKTLGKEIEHALDLLATPFVAVGSFFGTSKLKKSCASSARKVGAAVADFFRFEIKPLTALAVANISRSVSKGWNKVKKNVFRIVPPEESDKRMERRELFGDSEKIGKKSLVTPSQQNASLETSAGGFQFTSSLFTGLGVVIGGVLSAINTVKSIEMMNTGRSLLKNAPPSSTMPQQRAERAYGESLVRSGRAGFLINAGSVAGSITGVMQAAAQLAMIASPAARVTASAIFTVGTAVTAPLTLLLSGYGTKVNINRIRCSSGQLTLLRTELNRLKEIKRQMNIKQFTDETVKIGDQQVSLKEREEIVRFALRRLGDQKVNHIVGLVSNLFLMGGSLSAMAALVSGPASIAFGTLAIVLVAVGGGGALLTRGILVALRSRRKLHAQRKMSEGQGPRYISSKEMLAKAREILSSDESKGTHYWPDRKPVKDWNNGELLTFLLQGNSRRHTPDEMRGAFLAGSKHYWAKRFG